jgi:hypothetical protein
MIQCPVGTCETETPDATTTHLSSLQSPVSKKKKVSFVQLPTGDASVGSPVSFTVYSWNKQRKILGSVSTFDGSGLVIWFPDFPWRDF